MKNRITSAAAKAFRERWKAVNAAEREELLKTPITHKLIQLAALMASAEKMGWTEKLAAEETEVRERWNRLRKVLGEKNSKTGPGEKTKKVPHLETPDRKLSRGVEENEIRKRPAGVHRNAIFRHRELAVTLFFRRFNEDRRKIISD